jgi:phage terminase large subunit
MLSIEDGISATRSIFNQCWFDREKTMRGINALKNYRKEWDEKNKVFKNNPKHDWASHGADAFRTFGVGYRKPVNLQPQTNFGGVPSRIPGIIS